MLVDQLDVPTLGVEEMPRMQCGTLRLTFFKCLLNSASIVSDQTRTWCEACDIFF